MKTKWKVLKEIIKSEIKIVKPMLKSCIKEKDFLDASQFNKELSVLNWVLTRMKIIEETKKN